MNGTGRLVSVVVPTYNRVFCLARTIDSALAQTHESLEILVVDDGSSDGTGEMIRSRFGHDARVKYLWQENGGVSAARNTGLRASQGDYLAFLDSDDVWFPWKLKSQLACLDRLPHAGMIWSDMTAVGLEGETIAPTFLRTMYDAYRYFSVDELFPERFPLEEIVPETPELVGGWLRCGDIFSAMLMGSLVHTSTVVLRRERYEKVGLFDESIEVVGEDYDYHFRTCREGPVALLDRPTILYQLGLADRLSQFGKPLAISFVNTVRSRLAADRARITLPPARIREVLARAERWAGTELQDAGDRRAARPHFWASLCQKPWQPRVAAMLLLGFLPRSVDSLLRNSYRWLRGRTSEGVARSVTDASPIARRPGATA